MVVSALGDFDVEHGRERAVLVRGTEFLLDPEQHEARVLGTAEFEAPEELHEVERIPHQLAVEVAHHLVDVGDREADGGGLSIDFGDQRDLGVDEHLVLGRDDLQLLVGERDESPVLLPGGIEDVADDVHLAAEVLQVHRADLHAR